MTDNARTSAYARLSELSSRFAHVLQSLGVEPGATIYALMGHMPALFVSALGTWKHRGVFCALFSAFGPEPIQTRLAIGKGRVLVTTALLYTRKVAGLRASLPDLQHVLIVDAMDKPLPEDTHDFFQLLAEADEDYVIGPTEPNGAGAVAFHQRHDR